jgi:hypothetical protein
MEAVAYTETHIWVRKKGYEPVRLTGDAEPGEPLEKVEVKR